MLVIPQLAIRNLFGAGLRTWLNVFVLSVSFVAIIWTQGIYKGMQEQAVQAMVEAEVGGGQYWQANYDPYDPLTLKDAHAPIPAPLQNLIAQDQATSILITQGSIYPGGRLRTVVLKGIDPAQSILSVPASFLKTATADEALPALIGNRMAESSGLKVGDFVTVRWRDANGSFDATEAQIVQVMRTTVQTIDQGQLWVPLERLQQMTGLTNQATLIVLGQQTQPIEKTTGWDFKDLDFLLQDLEAMVQSKSIGASIMYSLLLFLAMLAIFNTQILSIFRRRKEMGTLMALGMTRGKVIQLFTLEGALHCVGAVIIAAIYGIPLLVYFTRNGLGFPQAVDSYGFALGEKIFPIYSAGLVGGTTLLIFIMTTIVSYLPTRKIAQLKPTDALRGKLT